MTLARLTAKHGLQDLGHDAGGRSYGLRDCGRAPRRAPAISEAMGEASVFPTVRRMALYPRCPRAYAGTMSLLGLAAPVEGSFSRQVRGNDSSPRGRGPPVVGRT
ncbi:hypothetical protein MRX96_040477 [Rhipicephalus microplus]